MIDDSDSDNAKAQSAYDLLKADIRAAMYHLAKTLPGWQQKTPDSKEPGSFDSRDAAKLLSRNGDQLRRCDV